MQKTVFLYILLFLVSCGKNDDTFKDIELLSYYYKGDENLRPNPDFTLYSYIDNKGNAKILQKDHKDSVIAYKKRINPILLERIIILSQESGQETFHVSLDTQNRILHQGLTNRFRIRYTSGKEISFNYVSNSSFKKNPNLTIVPELYSELIKDSIKSIILNVKSKGRLEGLLRKFTNYTIHQDSLRPPYPNLRKK